MHYRRDIDGLRAIAVVPVVIYHIAQSLLRGGYVGVDIFFVISGYLISHKIIDDARAGQFSAGRFWGARFRRIVPAHAVMLMIVSVIVLLRYFPSEAEDYGRSLIATVFSVSNFYFWATINYFNPAGDNLPLLHGWSLAVEEQFYLIFPIIVILIVRAAPARLERIVLLMFVASLGLCVAITSVAPGFGFYWIITRAWELLLGALLALNLAPPLSRRWQREVTGAAGIAMMGAAMLFYTPYMPFPGHLALLPCLGAAMVIHSGAQGDTVVARFLSLPPLVFIGAISYSLYLWHWPLIAFQKADALLIATDSKLVERGSVLVVSFVAAALSWWLVERPTRNRALVSMQALLIGFGVMLAAFVALGGVLVASGGLPGRYPPGANRLAGYLDYDFNRSMRVGQCLLSEQMPLAQFDRTTCLPDKPGRPSYLLIGDSHAGALSAGMIAYFRGANILQVTASGCLPMLEPQPLAPAASCDAVMRYALLAMPRARRLDGIWLNGRVGVGDIDANVAAMVDTAVRLQAAGQRVTIIGPNPEYRVPLPRLLAKAKLGGKPTDAAAFQSPEPMVADPRLKAAAQARGIAYLSLVEALCAAGRCRVEAAPDVPMLFDKDHFTQDGAEVVAQALAPRLIPAAAACRGRGCASASGAAARKGSSKIR